MVKQSSYFITQKLCLKLDNLLHIYNSWLHFLRQCAEIFWYVKKEGNRHMADSLLYNDYGDYSWLS